jgi:hypothetical protein
VLGPDLSEHVRAQAADPGPCYYFYLWDEDFGPAFIKLCAYFPYPGKVWVNGHEWAKRQAAKAGHTRLLRPLMAADRPPAPPEIRQALDTLDRHIAHTIDLARLPQAA